MVKIFKKNRENLPGSKELVTFSIFLFIAIALWLTSALGNKYEDEISIEVDFYNSPKEKVLYSALPSEIDMLISATGFTLLKYKFDNKLPKVNINLEKAIIKEDNEYKISKVVFFNQIEKQLGNSVVVKKVYYFDYDVDLSNVAVKEVDVIPNIKLDIEDQFHLTNPVRIEPSKIKIYGKKDVLDTVEFVYTEEIVLENIKSDVRKTVKLKNSNVYNFDIDNVDIVLNIEQITEKSLKIPVSIINVPDSIDIQIFPENVTLSFTVGFSKFDMIKSDYFSVQIDYNNIDLNNKYANIRLVRYPKTISNIRFTPKKAEYLLKKKK